MHVLSGQFVEVTYSTIPTQFIFDNMTTLLEPGFPLEGYDSLRDTKLVSTFIGKTGKLPGYVSYRPQTKQLIVAFAGTTTLTQAIYDVRALHHRHPSRRGQVHTGFWRLYKGMKISALEGIRTGLAEHDVTEVVIAGHSMGAVVSQLLLMDILRNEDLVSIGSIPLKLVVFGAPRSGNEELVTYWKELLTQRREKHGEGSIAEYSVKTFSDGKSSDTYLSLKAELVFQFQACPPCHHCHLATAIMPSRLFTSCTAGFTRCPLPRANMHYFTSLPTWKTRISSRTTRAVGTTTTTAVTWRSL